MIINDDLLLPINFIDILTYSRALVPALAYAPLTPPREKCSGWLGTSFHQANSTSTSGR